jgi:hypothetical protein
VHLFLRTATGIDSYCTTSVGLPQGIGPLGPTVTWLLGLRDQWATIKTGDIAYWRRGRKAPWLLEDAIFPSSDGSGDSRELRRLLTDVQWSAAETRRIRGHLCKGYTAVRFARSGTSWEQLTLWIDAHTGLPRAMRSCPRPPFYSLETATWDKWNSADLSIPTISVAG